MSLNLRTWRMPFHPRVWSMQHASTAVGLRTPHVKTREAFRDLRVEPSGKVTAANSYLKHNPKCYNQTNRRALTKLCLGQAAQNKVVKLWLQSCAAGTGLHFLFLSCHLSHTGRQRLQVSSCSNTHFSGTSRLLRNFQNKQF